MEIYTKQSVVRLLFVERNIHELERMDIWGGRVDTTLAEYNI